MLCISFGFVDQTSIMSQSKFRIHSESESSVSYQPNSNQPKDPINITIGLVMRTFTTAAYNRFYTFFGNPLLDPSQYLVSSVPSYDPHF